jgi:hypothetical protein
LAEPNLERTFVADRQRWRPDLNGGVGTSGVRRRTGGECERKKDEKQKTADD